MDLAICPCFQTQIYVRQPANQYCLDFCVPSTHLHIVLLPRIRQRSAIASRKKPAIHSINVKRKSLYATWYFIEPSR